MVSLQPYYVSALPGKTKNSTKTVDRLLQCILLNRLCQTFAEGRSVFVFPCLLENSFSSLLTENILFSISFNKSLSLNSIWLILTCELKLNCRDLQRATVMTPSSN